MGLQKLFAALAVCLLVAKSGNADQILPLPSEQPARVQQPYAQLSFAQPEAPQPDAQQPLLQTQYVEQPYYGEPTHIIPPESPPMAEVLPPPPCCEVCGSAGACQCCTPWCRRGWRLGLELYGLQSRVTDAAFGRWPDDGGLAAQISLGYEWMNGFGIRGNSWGFGQDAEIPGPSNDVELSMGTFHLDFYKAIVAGHSELVLGAGPAGSSLRFRIPSLGERTRFSGGGASVFAEGYYPFHCRPCWEVAFVGETRMSLVTGDWRDNGGVIVGDTDGDSMSIWEIGFGLEYRRRFGQLSDHYWFIQAMPEYQQWTSQWMGEFLGSSVSLTGLNLNLGFVW